MELVQLEALRARRDAERSAPAPDSTAGSGRARLRIYVPATEAGPLAITADREGPPPAA